MTFRLASGAEVRATGRVLRCHVGSLESGRILYDVAFRFDESVGLNFPTVMPPPAVGAGDVRLAAVGMPPEARAQVLNHSVAFQNELLAHFVATGTLPSGLRDAVSKLTNVNAALVAIGATLREARRIRTPDPELLDLAKRLAPRIRELHALRSVVVDSIGRDDLVLIAAQANRLQLSTLRPAARKPTIRESRESDHAWQLASAER